MQEDNSLVQPSLKVFLISSLMSSAILYGAYHFYQQYQRKKRQELREFELAVEHFYSIIGTINYEISQCDLMIANYQQQFSQIRQAISKLLPENKSNDISLVKTKNDYADDWNELLKIYHQAIAEYPDIPDLIKMSPKEIQQQCGIFQEHHQKVKGFSEHLAQKSAEDLREYESLMPRAQNLSSMRR
ncbi:MAG TPA: hypothetical protein DCZ80_01920 [Legionellales bacterium]|nr:hypothetical protein [Legionellales bacterium]